MRLHTRNGAVLALVCTALLIAGCGSDSDDPEPSDDGSDPVADSDTDDGDNDNDNDGDDNDDDVTPPPPETPPETPSWRVEHEGTVSGSRVLAGNDDIVVALSRELRDRGWMTAVDPETGDELWRLADVAVGSCAPVVTAGGDVVAHFDAATEAGGEDRSDDLVLVDGASGAVLDSWEPGNAQFSACANTASLHLSDSGLLLYTQRTTQRAWRLDDDEITPLWERDRGDGNDPLAGSRNDGASPPDYRGYEVVIGDRLYSVATDDHSDGFDNATSVYQIDTTTGAVVGRIETDIRQASALHVAGPGELLVLGADKDRDESVAVLIGNAGPDAADGAMTIDWMRGFDGNGDGVTRAPSGDEIALSDGAFASWSTIAGGATVTEFDLATGQANWSALTSSFSNDDDIAALPEGGYAVYPFGGNFLEAFDTNGDPAWEIADVPEGLDGPLEMARHGENNLVLLVRTEDGWGLIGVDTRR